MTGSPRRRKILAGAWILLVGVGLTVLWNYEAGPGPVGEAPAIWPIDSSIEPQPGAANLVMMVHPHCPCTKASFGELNRLLAACDGAVTPHLAFYQPHDSEPDWYESSLWRSASTVPGARVFHDIDGREASRFGARTSGHVVLYDAEGRLVFSGGITVSRGHEGDNRGRSAITQFVRTGRAGVAESPVFGCGLGEEACTDCPSDETGTPCCEGEPL